MARQSPFVALNISPSPKHGINGQSPGISKMHRGASEANGIRPKMAF
jgi:hypothetical protein